MGRPRADPGRLARPHGPRPLRGSSLRLRGANPVARPQGPRVQGDGLAGLQAAEHLAGAAAGPAQLDLAYVDPIVPHAEHHPFPCGEVDHGALGDDHGRLRPREFRVTLEARRDAEVVQLDPGRVRVAAIEAHLGADPMVDSTVGLTWVTVPENVSPGYATRRTVLRSPTFTAFSLA